MATWQRGGLIRSCYATLIDQCQQFSSVKYRLSPLFSWKEQTEESVTVSMKERGISLYRTPLELAHPKSAANINIAGIFERHALNAPI